MDPVVLIVAAGLMGAWLLQATPELQKTVVDDAVGFFCNHAQSGPRSPLGVDTR